MKIANRKPKNEKALVVTSVYMSPDLVRAADRQAQKEERSRNFVIVRAIKKDLEAA